MAHNGTNYLVFFIFLSKKCSKYLIPRGKLNSFMSSLS